ncbi:flagellar filament capping protein FliD, partial [Bacillus cereus]
TLFQDMGLAKADGTALNTINEAQNAMYTINGIKGEGSTNTIEALPGVKIELLKVTEPKVEGAPDAGTTDPKS